jgi:hypothetical protein
MLDADSIPVWSTIPLTFVRLESTAAICVALTSRRGPPRARTPIARKSRSTVHRATRMPSRRSCRHTFPGPVPLLVLAHVPHFTSEILITPRSRRPLCRICCAVHWRYRIPGEGNRC